MDDPKEFYLVWSNEHRAWWLPGGIGYTERSADAARMTRARALEICVAAIPGTAKRLGMLPELAVRETDVRAIMQTVGSFGADL